MGLPKRQQDFIRKHKWIVEAVGLLPAFIAGIIGTSKVYDQLAKANDLMMGADRGGLDFSGLYWILAGAVAAILYAGFKTWLAYAESKAVAIRESPNDIWGCCFIMRSLLCSDDPEHSLRIAVYRVNDDGVGDARELEQLIPYAAKNGAERTGPGRILPSGCGIVGRVARGGEPLAASRVAEDVEEFRAEMVAVWGFTKMQAEGLNVSRWSWMAVPIVDESQRVVGVVYLDSKKRNYFDDRRIADVLAGCEALNAFVLERYP